MSAFCALDGMHAIHGMQPYGPPTAFDFDIHVEIPAISRYSAQNNAIISEFFEEARAKGETSPTRGSMNLFSKFIVVASGGGKVGKSVHRARHKRAKCMHKRRKQGIVRSIRARVC